MWIAARCLRPCDRLLSPWSVIFLQLERARVSEQSLYLPAKIQADSVESCKMLEAL